MPPSKRDALLRKAQGAFYRYGFHATNMDRLVAEPGVSKTSMYKHFRTKEELILGTLRLRDEQFRNWLFRRMAALGATPAAALPAMFDALAEWFAEPGFRGGMFVKASAEYQDADHPIHAQSAAHKRLLFAHVRDLAAGAADPAALARRLLLLKEGAIVTAQFGHAADPAGNAKAVAATLVTAAEGEGA